MGEDREGKPNTPRAPARSDSGAWRPAFLAALRNSANIRASCQAAGVSRGVAYDHMRRDPEFAAEWASALEDALDVVEAQAFKRAREGSDDIVKFLLRSHRPKVYGDQRQVRIGNVEGEVLRQEIGSLADIVRLANGHVGGDVDPSEQG